MTDYPMTWEQAVRWCMSEPVMADLVRDTYFGDPVQTARRYHASAEFAAVKAVLPLRPGRALDLGAGNGILSYALAAEGWKVTAVEPDPSDLIGAGAIRAMASATQAKITVIEAFGEAIPLEAAGFDLVVARQVLHHAHDLRAFCREMHRLSRPGAMMLTLRDHVISGPEQMSAFLDGHPLHYLYGGENAFTLSQYRSALTGGGLTILSEWRSFQSVMNYDPMRPAEILRKLAALTGPVAPLTHGVLAALPFAWVAALAAAADRRPGRLVSFLARKDG
jgi:SAM-dependent methyltransferase